MKDLILKTAKDYIEKEVIKNKDVPEQDCKNVSDVIFSSLQSHLSGGGSGLNLGQLGGLLGGVGGGGNNVLIKTVADALVSKTGMQAAIAQSIAGAIVPGLLKSVTQKGAGGVLGGVLGKK